MVDRGSPSGWASLAPYHIRCVRLAHQEHEALLEVVSIASYLASKE